MAHRHFEGKAHALLYGKYRPCPPTHLIERIVSFLQEKYTGTLNTNVDVGCGSGQSTGFFSKYFKNVIGTDISKEQINNAIKLNTASNVSYWVSPAEKIDKPDNSVQLISVSQAAHWFNLPAFYKETHRVLDRNAVLSIYGYEFPLFVTGDNNKDRLLNQCLQNLYRVDLHGYVLQQSVEVYIGNYTEKKYQFGLINHDALTNTNSSGLSRKHVDNRYTDPMFNFGQHSDSEQRDYPAFRDFTREDNFYEDQESSLLDMLNYVLTWSGFQNYVKNNGEEQGTKLLKKYENELLEIMGTKADPQDILFTKRTKFFLLMGRK